MTRSPTSPRAHLPLLVTGGTLAFLLVLVAANQYGPDLTAGAAQRRFGVTAPRQVRPGQQIEIRWGPPNPGRYPKEKIELIVRKGATTRRYTLTARTGNDGTERVRIPRTAAIGGKATFRLTAVDTAGRLRTLVRTSSRPASTVIGPVVAIAEEGSGGSSSSSGSGAGGGGAGTGSTSTATGTATGGEGGTGTVITEASPSPNPSPSPTATARPTPAPISGARVTGRVLRVDRISATLVRVVVQNATVEGPGGSPHLDDVRRVRIRTTPGDTITIALGNQRTGRLSVLDLRPDHIITATGTYSPTTAVLANADVTGVLSER